MFRVFRNLTEKWVGPEKVDEATRRIAFLRDWPVRLIMTRMKIIGLICLCMASRAMAEPPWPKKLASPKFAEVETVRLPAGLRYELLAYDDMNPDTDELPAKVRLCRVDLNGDGRPEFIVENGLGGSGGPGYYIFEQQNDHTFKQIANLQGGFYFARRLNRYYQIVSESRAGGGMFTRTLERFEGKRYHLVRLADYRMLDEDINEFVRERDPKPYDN